MPKALLVIGVLIVGTRPSLGAELTGVNPTVFNFVSDLMGIAIQTIFSFCIAGCYGLFVSRHLNADKTIPLKALGSIPNDLFSGMTTARHVSWSIPLVAFAVLLGVSEFSHAIADLGLSFEASKTQGSIEPVVSLAPVIRNEKMLLEALGDPYNARTQINLEAGLDDYMPEDERAEFAKQARRVTSFMYAVDNVAKGVWPFLSPESLYASNQRLGSRGTMDEMPEYGGIAIANIFHARDVHEDAFIVGIDLDLPMNCEGMVDAEQIQGALNGGDYITSLSKFPGCSYDSLRSSGVYRDDDEGDNNRNRAEIISYLTHLMMPQESDFSIVAGGRNLDAFMLPYSSRALARDRPDVRQGRLVDDIVDYRTLISLGKIEAIQIGTVTFPVASVVVATGKPLGRQNGFQLTEYGFVAEIEGGCPLDPDGVVQPSCMAMFGAHCQTFPEDAAISLDDIDPNDDTLCLLADIEIIWGRNFVADGALAAAVAGIYGRNRLAARNPYESAILSLHLIPAAMFVLSSVKHLPSNSDVVTPVISGVYIFFMILPLAMAISAFCIAYRHKQRDNVLIIPDETWKMAVIGNESKQFPHNRLNCHEEFPDVLADLQYGIIGRDSEAKSQRAILGILLPKTRKTSKNGAAGWRGSGCAPGNGAGSPITPPSTPSPRRNRKKRLVHSADSDSDDCLGCVSTPPLSPTYASEIEL